METRERIVIGNVARSNGGSGFSGYSASTIKNNLAIMNDAYGISFGGTANNPVDGNTSFLNNQSHGGYDNIVSCPCIYAGQRPALRLYVVQRFDESRHGAT